MANNSFRAWPKSADVSFREIAVKAYSSKGKDSLAIFSLCEKKKDSARWGYGYIMDNLFLVARNRFNSKVDLLFFIRCAADGKETTTISLRETQIFCRLSRDRRKILPSEKLPANKHPAADSARRRSGSARTNVSSLPFFCFHLRFHQVSPRLALILHRPRDTSAFRTAFRGWKFCEARSLPGNLSPTLE